MKNLLILFAVSILIISCQNTPKKSTESNIENSKNTEVQKKVKPDIATPSSSQTDTKLQGIDISSFQTGIDWDKVKGDEISFVMVKATGGRTYVDPSFVKHWEDVKQAGLARGAYHFYYTKDSPEAQANFFISNVLSSSSANDLPPIIDIETDGVNTEITVDQLQKDIMTFLTIVEKAFNRKPILYTSDFFAKKYFNNPEFDQYYLWLAAYQNESPNAPAAWSKSGWMFWQNSPSAIVNGINGKVDHDIFKGSMADLMGLK